MKIYQEKETFSENHTKVLSALHEGQSMFCVASDINA
jgi:hypothetical protein